MKFSREPIFYILLAYVFIAAFTILYFDGTGDSGDSITHYLFAKYAPQHPALFFDHWAKPVFVMLASPFAHFGFAGMKIFNALATFFTILFTYRIAEKLNFKNSYAVAIILIFSPVYYVLTFSGLTEPLFALFLVLGIYGCICEKYFPAALLISFLPFVRSEGLIILGIFGLYFLMKRRWKLIPWLAAGHVVYSIAGSFVYGDLLWVFRKIPYAHLDSVYGHGELLHFTKELFYITGFPALILFCFGFIKTIISIRKKFIPEIHLLIAGAFLAFFIAHSLFWYFGIFGSMGLTRVFICVIPLMGLMMLEGLNLITGDFFKPFASTVIRSIILLYIVIFPFTKTKGAVVFHRDMYLSNEQNAAFETAREIRSKYPVLPKIAFGCPTLALAMNIDPFDPVQHADLNPENIRNLKTGDLVIWDNHFALLDTKLDKATLKNDPALAEILVMRKTDENNSVSEFVVYRKK